MSLCPSSFAASTFVYLAGAVVLGLLPGIVGCEDKPHLPPELQQSRAQTIDHLHAATLRGSEAIVVPNLVMTITAGRGADKINVSLMSRAPHDYPALVLTASDPNEGGASVPYSSADALMGRQFVLTGPGGRWLGPGDGIRSHRWRYQTEEAVLIIDEVDGESVRGRIEGKFHRFLRDNPEAHPSQAEEIRGVFRAVIEP
jgi:hypothetical protein